MDVIDRLDRRSTPTSALPPAALAAVEAALHKRPVRRIAVVVTGEPGVLGATLARAFPDADVHVLVHARHLRPEAGARRRVTVHLTPTIEKIREVLSALPPLSLLVEAAVAEPVKSAVLRHLLFQVEDGGLYVVAALSRLHEGGVSAAIDAAGWPALARIVQAKADPETVTREGWHRDELPRADAVASVKHTAGVILIRKSGHHALRLHDTDAERFIAGRNGPAWGRVLETRDPVDPPISRKPHANRLVDTFRTAMPVPRMYLREYRDVICAPRQLAVQGDAILPISYHHGLGKRLNTRSSLVTPVDAHYALLDPVLETAERIPGTYFHLDSEFPGHFGHWMTEDIAKLWGWAPVRATWPDARILLSTLEEGGRPSTVQRTLLEAWGVDPADVICIDRPVRIDRLVGATQMYYNGIYVHPELHDIWARLREALRTPAAERTPQPARIFVTRPPNSLRPCRNAAEVEAVFTEHGFAIVRPELMSIREQVDLFAEAEFVAGFGGSGMFSAVYGERPGRRVVITSDQYKARNEWAIAAAKGDDYHHFFGTPELAPGQAEASRLFHSPFVFDMDRDGDALRRLVG